MVFEQKYNNCKTLANEHQMFTKHQMIFTKYK